MTLKRSVLLTGATGYIGLAHLGWLVDGGQYRRRR